MSKFDGNRFGMIAGLEYQNTDNNYTAYTNLYWYCGFNGPSWFGDPYVPGVLEVANQQQSFLLLGIYDMNSFAFLMRAYSGMPSFYIKNPPWYNGTGSNGVVMANIQGMGIAASATGAQYYVYLLEVIPATNTGVVEFWNMNPPQPTLMDDFGEDFFYDPLDLTVDSDGNVYILEENADGEPAIWVYDDTGALIGASDPIDPTYLSGDPLRMDCRLSSDPDEVHVLHSDGLTRFVLQ